MGVQTQGLACGGGPSGKRLGSGWGGWPPESTPLWGREGAGLADSGRRSRPVLLPPPRGLQKDLRSLGLSFPSGLHCLISRYSLRLHWASFPPRLLRSGARPPAECPTHLAPSQHPLPSPLPPCLPARAGPNHGRRDSHGGASGSGAGGALRANSGQQRCLPSPPAALGLLMNLSEPQSPCLHHPQNSRPFLRYC